MATLADQLKRNRQQSQGLVRGPGGQLQQLTGAGIQQLAQARGLEAPPTSPLGGQAIGATPDQVKMLGDARQKRAALDVGVTGGLAEARRTKQVRTEATGEELATFEKSVALQKLGPTGQKAGELIDVATASLSTTKLKKPLVSLSAAGRELAPDIQKLVISYVDGSGRTPETLNQIADALKTTADKVNVLTYIDSNTLTVETTRELAAEMAKLAPDTVTLGQLYPTGVSANLGLTETELASLGITEAQLASYTMTQLQDFLAQQRTQLLSEPVAVRAGLADPNLSQAEREELRGQLRGLSAVGVLGVEQAVADLVAQIEAADQVTYRDPVTGETVTRAIGDLLADEEVSKLIIQFLGLTPEQQSKLLADAANPLANLYKWISGNADNIKALTTEGAEAFTGEQKQVQENVALANVSGFQVPNEIMTAIYGANWNKFGAGKLDQTKPLYQLIAKASNPKEVIDLLSKVPADMLQKLNQVPAGKLTTQLIQQARDEATSITELAKAVDPKSGNPTDFLKFEELLGGLLAKFNINAGEIKRLADLVSLGLVKDTSGLITLLSPPNYYQSTDPDIGKIGSMGKGVAAKIISILQGMTNKLGTGDSVSTQVTTAVPTKAIRENKLILDAHNSYIGDKLRAGKSITNLLADSTLPKIKEWEGILKLLAEKTGLKPYRDAYAQIQVMRATKETDEQTAADAATDSTEAAQSRSASGRQALSSGTYKPDQLPSIYADITASWPPASRSTMTSNLFTSLMQGVRPNQAADIANIMKYPEYALELVQLTRLGSVHPDLISAVMGEVRKRRAAGNKITGAYLREIMKDPASALRNISFRDPAGGNRIGYLESDGRGGYVLRYKTYTAP